MLIKIKIRTDYFYKLNNSSCETMDDGCHNKDATVPYIVEINV